jgi:hypothetical protein
MFESAEFPSVWRPGLAMLLFSTTSLTPSAVLLDSLVSQDPGSWLPAPTGISDVHVALFQFSDAPQPRLGLSKTVSLPPKMSFPWILSELSLYPTPVMTPDSLWIFLGYRGDGVWPVESTFDLHLRPCAHARGLCTSCHPTV